MPFAPRAFAAASWSAYGNALVVAGPMNKKIAAELGTAEQMIKQHRYRVMQKLGARSVAGLVRLAERLEGAR